MMLKASTKTVIQLTWAPASLLSQFPTKYDIIMEEIIFTHKIDFSKDLTITLKNSQQSGKNAESTTSCFLLKNRDF